jgi:phosphohistidine phosphatase
MKTVWLVRHAKSSWDIDLLDDINRPLNNRGYQDAVDMAQRMKKKVGEPLLVSSPAIRAVSTALIFAQHFGIDPSQIRIRATLYGTSPTQYCSTMAAQADEINELFIFGHNPIISETANFLSGTTISEIPTCGIVGIAFEESTWKKAISGMGKIIHYDFPKNKTEA